MAIPRKVEYLVNPRTPAQIVVKGEAEGDDFSVILVQDQDIISLGGLDGTNAMITALEDIKDLLGGVT